MNLESFPWLSSIILLPLIGALIMPFLSTKEGEDNSLPRNISLSFLFIDFLLIIGVLFQKFNTSDSSLQLVERASWLPSIGSEWSLGVDGLSAPLVALSGLITFLSAAASWKIKKKSNLYFALLTGIGLSMLIESSKVIRDRIRRKSVKQKIHYHNWAHRLPFKVRFYKSKLYISIIPPIIIGFVIGILSATMGIGGAFILIPAMIYFLGMPTSKVIGTSLFQIIFITALVTILHATTTFAVDAVLAFFLILSSVIGAQVGVLAANKLRGEEIRALLAIIVLGVATKIALDLLVEPNEIFNLSVIRLVF